jgi:FkbM family methyltransferase
MSIELSVIDSLVFKVLMKTCRYDLPSFLRGLWTTMHDAFAARKRTVLITIHKRPAIVNFGYTYPIIVRRYPNFNAPLLALTRVMNEARERLVRLVDVGSAIGDTVLLIQANVGARIEEYVCVDGDPYFFKCLEQNTAFLENIRRFRAQLSKHGDQRSSLVMTNLGTASAVGAAQVATKTLDQLFQENGVGPVDVLKIDVDGYDGEVLGGATRILNTDKPGVIFEWHPTIWAETKTDTKDPFRTLFECGYSRLLWFTNEGFFHGFSESSDVDTIERLEKLCLSRRTNPHLHFDIVALPPDADHLWLDVAELQGWAGRVSPW